MKPQKKIKTGKWGLFGESDKNVKKFIGLNTSFKVLSGNRDFSFFHWGVLFVFLTFFYHLAEAKFQSSVNVGLLGDFYFQRNIHNAQGFIDVFMGHKGIENEFWLDIGAGALVGTTSQSYIKIPQFYYQMNFTKRIHLIVGRYLNQWSYLDDHWMTGMIQPLFKWNMALPEKQGLTGLFLKLHLTDNIDLTFFSSYLFLPSQGPVYELVNGRVVSSNPWFAQPVRVMNFLNQEIELRYNVNAPKTSDVIFRPSYGGRVGTSYDKTGWLLSAFYFNKSKNDLITPFNGHLNLTTFEGDVTIQPTVARHDVLGLDVGWNFGYLKSLISWLHESRIYYRRFPDFTYPVIPRQDLFSIFQWIRLSKSQSLSLSYLKVIREPNKIEGIFSDSQISTFLSRNTFENTVRLKWEGRFLESVDRSFLKTSFSYFQSFIVDHAWVSVDFQWFLNKRVALTSRCDFFGGYNQSPVDADFISQFQNNDRCLVGGSYAF